MSQHIPQQHHPQPHYVHYTPPTAHPFTHVAPKDTQHQPQSQPQQQPQPLQQQQQPQQTQQPQQQAAQGSGSGTPLVATGDWTKDLVHLAKTAELKCVFIIDVSLVVAGRYLHSYRSVPLLHLSQKLTISLSSQKTCAYIATTYRSYLICSC